MSFIKNFLNRVRKQSTEQEQRDQAEEALRQRDVIESLNWTGLVKEKLNNDGIGCVRCLRWVSVGESRLNNDLPWLEVSWGCRKPARFELSNELANCMEQIYGTEAQSESDVERKHQNRCMGELNFRLYIPAKGKTIHFQSNEQIWRNHIC